MSVFWKSRWIQGELISQNRNMMNVRFFNSKDGFNWVLTNVYAPNSKWRRKALWEEILNKRKLFANENWIVMGEFNTLLKEAEKWGGSQTNLDNRLDLMDFIDHHLLHDLDLHGT